MPILNNRFFGTTADSIKYPVVDTFPPEYPASWTLTAGMNTLAPLNKEVKRLRGSGKKVYTFTTHGMRRFDPPRPVWYMLWHNTMNDAYVAEIAFTV